MADALFCLAFSTLLAHELDAVHKHEWRLLFVLRCMPEERARQAFVVAHVPLVAVLLWLAAHPSDAVRLWMMGSLDAFMVVHAALHWRLRTHPAYAFNTPTSSALILGAAALGALHLAVLVL